MKEPERLLDGDRHPEAQTLLAAGRDDAPTPGAMGRTLVSLGLGTAVATVATTSAASTTTAATGLVKGASTVSLAVIAKWATGSLVLGAVVLVSALPISGAKEGPTHTDARQFPQPAGAAPHRTAEAAPTAFAETTSPPRPEPSRAVVLPSSPQRRPTRPIDVSAAKPDSLSPEVALVDAARRALVRGDPGEALGHLNRHEREHPHGLLRPEAFVLRLEAMVRAGRSEAARELARRYLESNPRGAHAQSIRKIAGE